MEKSSQEEDSKTELDEANIITSAEGEVTMTDEENKEKEPSLIDEETQIMEDQELKKFCFY